MFHFVLLELIEVNILLEKFFIVLSNSLEINFFLFLIIQT